jgi:opacity protein-like surface antigen
MFRQIAFTAALALLLMTANAQRTEVGIFAGGANYMGDLTPSISLNETHFAAGVFIRQPVATSWNLRGGINTGMISGSDQNQSDQALVARNLSFRSRIIEAELRAEYLLAPTKRLTPVLFAGLAGFHHNPQAFYSGEWIDLQPLGTEGQGTSANARAPYSKLQLAINAGGGLQYALTRNWNLGLELGFRKTFTDYLDDVSTVYVDEAILAAENGALAVALNDRSGELGEDQFSAGDARGNPDMKDWYLLGGATLSYAFGGDGMGKAHRGGRININNKGCYSF